MSLSSTEKLQKIIVEAYEEIFILLVSECEDASSDPSALPARYRILIEDTLLPQLEYIISLHSPSFSDSKDKLALERLYNSPSAVKIIRPGGSSRATGCLSSVKHLSKKLLKHALRKAQRASRISS